MHRIRHSIAAVLVASLFCLLTACTSSASPGPISNGVSASVQPGAADCPTSIKCVVQKAALADATSTGDGVCNYSPLGKATDQWHASGVVVHTTEGGTDSALAEVQNPTACLSWNYLVAPDGTIYENVPPGNMTFSVNNRFYNTDYIQIEHVGHAADCDVTDAEYKASAKLVSYLAKRYSFPVSSSTLIGHDSVPGIDDEIQVSQHWDPGTCWNWNQYLKLAGAIASSASSDSKVVEITAAFSGAKGNNFVPLYSSPSTSSPLVSDPYVRDGATGTTAPSDWSDKATVGHSYAVAKRINGWTGIWFGGKIAWFKGSGKSVALKTVSPKSSGIAVYGRPMPSSTEFSASKLPQSVIAAQDLPAQLTRYTMKQGQSYVLVSDSVKNQFFEGCDKTDCSGPFDGAIVTGKEKYFEIEWNHRYVFVKASDVNING